MNMKLETRNPEPRKWLCVEPPVLEYREALGLQHSLVAARKDKIIDTDIACYWSIPLSLPLAAGEGRRT